MVRRWNKHSGTIPLSRKKGHLQRRSQRDGRSRDIRVDGTTREGVQVRDEDVECEGLPSRPSLGRSWSSSPSNHGEEGVGGPRGPRRIPVSVLQVKSPKYGVRGKGEDGPVNSGNSSESSGVTTEPRPPPTGVQVGTPTSFLSHEDRGSSLSLS